MPAIPAAAKQCPTRLSALVPMALGNALSEATDGVDELPGAILVSTTLMVLMSTPA